ncbi:MAG: YfhO family protein [Deltaproteobacteria bacterium]|nr:YfhO family protein [Deltaproteobacteria bacterium]
MRHRYRLPFACSIFALTLVVLFSHAIFTKKIILVSNMRTSNPFLSIKGASPFPIEPFDTVNQFLPWFHFDRESIRDLSLPLWNPYNGCGAPHIANMQSALFYPLNAFVYLLNWKWGLLLLYFFKFFLIGLFSYLYLTEIGTDYRAAIVASIAAMYSGFMYMFEFQMTGAAFCFFLGLWALELIIKYPDRFKGYALLLIAFVIAVFTGHPEILFFMTFVLGLYFLIRLSAGPRDGGKPHGVPPYTILLKAGIVICIGILISAIQLLPFIQYLHASTVFVSRASGTTAPFYPFSVLLPAIGNFFGKNMITINTSANWINAGLNYVGIVFFLFGVAGIAGLFRERLTKAYTALFVVTMIIPFNVPLLHNVLAAIPGFDVAEKSHLLIFSGYMLILIGAKYLDALLNGKCNLKTLYVAVYITISLILALYLISGTYYRLNTALVYMVLIMMIAVIFIIKIKNKDVVAALLGIMTFLPAVMGTISASLLDRSSFFPTNTIIDTIRRDTSVFRVLPLMKDGIKSWEPDLNTFYAIEDPRSYDTMGVRWYDTFVLKLLTEPGIIDFLNVKYLISPGAPVLAEASAYRSRISEPVFKENNTIRTYLNRFSFDVDMPVSAFQPVVSANGFTLYENPNALNRAFMVYDYKVADTHQRAFELVKQYASQLSTTAVIFKGDARYASFMPDNTTTSALNNTVSFEKYTPNRIKMRVDTSSPGLLVISNTYFPGWHASIDGRKAKVMRTDYAFQGVFVPKGHHEVRLDYMPLSFVIGLILSIAGIAAIPLIYIFSFQ